MRSAVSQRRIWSSGAWIIGTCLGGVTGAVEAGDVSIVPSLGVQELVTDNVLLTPTNRRSDFVTTISPGIAVTADTPRLQARLDYSPTLYRYALTPSQNLIGQSLYANGTTTVAPDLFFIDARGYASLQPSTPGLATGGLNGTSISPTVGAGVTNPSQGIPTTQLTQVSSFSASPYLTHRFDGFGTGALRYTLSNTNFSGGTNTLLSPTGIALQNTATTTNEATATFLTGENFGPFASRLLLDTAQSTGTGVFNNASNQLATIDAAYAITRRISALGTIGYEEIRFSGIPPTRISDVVWAAGVRLTPSPDTTITATYGHQNGFTAPNVSLSWNLTELTTLTASYSEGLSTSAQDIANNLAVSDVNPLGQLIDTRTSQPLLISNPALGLQSGVFRARNLTATGTVRLQRDQITASVYRSENLLVAQSSPGSGTSQRVTGASLAWSHELNPLTTATLGLGYSHSAFPSSTAMEQSLFTISASISYAFNSSLTGWAGYNHLDRSSPQPQQRLVSNTALVGLRKSF